MKKLLSTILAVSLFVSIVPVLSFPAEAAGKMTADQLKVKFPAGKYWNGGNEDSYTSNPCTHHSSGCTYSGDCGCNSFHGLSIQCMGYAEKLGYDFSGFNPRENANGWTTYTDISALDSIKAGDIVRNNRHSVFVTAVNGDMVTFTDCNWDGGCQIRWDITKSKDTFKTNFTYVRSAPFTISASPVLAVTYNANGGVIKNSGITGYTYTITDPAGINMRKGAGTGYDKITALMAGTRFTVAVGNTKTANGYTWGKTTVDGNTGWLVISDFVSQTGTLRGTEYYTDNSIIYLTENGETLQQAMPYGETVSGGLWNAASLGLTRDGYRFLGWSLKAKGGTVIHQDRALKPEEIVPELKNGSKSVTLYAIWEKGVAVTRQPVSANAKIGEMVEVSLAAEGEGLTYQWHYKNKGSNTWFVTSAFTGNRYYVPMTAARDGRQLYCVITDKYGNTAKTNTVTISIAKPVKITKQPVSAKVKSGATAEVTVVAAGEGLTYQWHYKNKGSNTWFVTSAFTGNRYYVPMTAARDGRQLYCVVTDKYGNTAKTNTVTISIAKPVKITKQPVSAKVKSGATAEVTVVAAGEGLTYQWHYKNKGSNTWFVTSAFTGNRYYVPMTAVRNGRQLYCVVTDKYGNTAKTNTVTINMK